ncbi:uncharacterized protein LOC114299337 [Camellia sinensis]|uniref:uncharacterized protein LOC114299337 n=1 Tax=Camellia sinensis TaxID=4442 RepID=UPI001036A546|nr:uncharacterized protein LOC114299337 [Camellia sinensis]
MATKRHNRNLIASIEVNGVEVGEPSEVKQAVCHHFQNLFTKQRRYWPSIGGEFKKIEDNQAVDSLEREFTKEEMWAAIKECDGNKAPGPDGFNMLFFQKSWKFLKGDIMKFMKEFYSNSKLGYGVNCSFVTLIPKKDNPNSLIDYRPISLINSPYKMLSSFGFGPRWISWMKECLESTRISVLVNGSPSVEFCPQKRLRQGDPLFPFLFNVVTEGLNILLRRAKQLGIIKGVVVGDREVNISYLQFADDTILFCEAEWVEIVAMKRILRCFEVISGLKINFHKSLICGVGVDDGLVEEFAAKLNCLSQKLPLKYLGMPLGANPGRKQAWQLMLDRFKKKLSG